MASGLVALLDDIAALTKLAAASLDDVAGAAGKAGAKAAGVVIDDTAVTPRYVVGLTPDRELPIIWKIALGSLRNKMLILLPAAIALSLFAPWAITPLLMVGGAYLCFEAAEKIIEALTGHGHDDDAEMAAITDPMELEKRQVSGAIRTDFILSAEIMAIALAQLPEQSFAMQASALAAVAVAITAGVYGVVALIVKMDDIGLHLAQRRTRGVRALGRGLVAGMPMLLQALSGIGTAAMLWVGGGIVVHGFGTYRPAWVPHWMHGLTGAAVSAVAGMIVGTAIVAVLHVMRRARR